MTYCLCATSKVVRRLLLPAILCLFSLPAAHAFDKLSEAQSWVYDRPHLSNTQNGQTIEYRYVAQNTETEAVEDKATLTIVATGESGRRDVEVDFLSDERKLPLPAFNGYKGNPVIIAMLEHIAQNMGTETGGGVLYFRNRIRDALSSDQVKLASSVSQFNDSDVESTRLTFLPFVNDSYLKGNALLASAEFTIELSDDVPAGVIAVGVSAQNGNEQFNRQLTLK